jgi:hypothetical protein
MAQVLVLGSNPQDCQKNQKKMAPSAQSGRWAASTKMRALDTGDISLPVSGTLGSRG